MGTNVFGRGKMCKGMENGNHTVFWEELQLATLSQIVKFGRGAGGKREDSRGREGPDLEVFCMTG